MQTQTSLRQAAAAGVKWTGLSSGAITGIQLFQLAVLTRLLTAEEFGLMATVLIVIGFANGFADMGVSNAIIHRQSANRSQLSTLYWAGLGTGLVLFLLLLALRPVIVGFFDEPRLYDLLFWSALVFIVTPFGQQFQALLHKELRFGTLERIRITAAAVGAAVAIATAFLGQGVYALIWGQLTTTLIRATMLCVAGWRHWRPVFHFNPADLRGYIGFGAYQMGERSINFFSAKIDYIVIARVLGPESLGVYHIAYQIVIAPLVHINPVLTRVAFPVFARRQSDDAALRRGYLELSKLLGFLAFPLLLGMAATAPVLVPVLFGEQWVAAAGLVPILVIVATFKTLGNPVGSILLAKGRADLGFKWNLGVAAANSIAFMSVISYGLPTLAGTYAALSICYFAGMRLLLFRLIRLGWKEYIHALALPAFTALAMWSSVHLAFRVFAGVLENDRLLLLALITAGFTVYAVLWLLADQRYVKELWNQFVPSQTGAV